MFEFEKMCRKYEELSYTELKEIIENESRIILPALDAVEGDGLDTFFLFAAAACGADGKLDLAEYKLFEEVTGISLSYEEATEYVAAASGKGVQALVDSIVEMFGVLDDDINTASSFSALPSVPRTGRST